MSAGVSRCSILIVSHALCAGSLSCWNISQGSVATHLRWGGMFINTFIAQFQLSTSVKELWKSVYILQRYGQEYSVSFFWLTVYVAFIGIEILTLWVQFPRPSSRENLTDCPMPIVCQHIRPQLFELYCILRGCIVSWPAFLVIECLAIMDSVCKLVSYLPWVVVQALKFPTSWFS